MTSVSEKPFTVDLIDHRCFIESMSHKLTSSLILLMMGGFFIGIATISEM